MTEKQEKKLANQRAVMDVMEKNLDKWQSIAELKNKYDLFVRNIKRIDDSIGHVGTDLAPLKEKKLMSRKDLVEKLFPLTSVLGVYAIDTGDSKLGKMVNMKFSELEKMDTEALKKYATRILKISGSLFEKKSEELKKAPKQMIADYGLTAKHLDSLREALDQFTGNEEKLSETRSLKKKGKRKLNKYIRENNTLLKKKIDRMILLFRDTQKDFYEEYMNNRFTAMMKPSRKKREADTGDPGMKVNAAVKAASKNKEAASAKSAAASESVPTKKSSATKKSSSKSAGGSTNRKIPSASQKDGSAAGNS